MNLVVDTSVWSLVLRRRQVRDDDAYVLAFRSHVERGDGLFLVGPILQELLGGLKRPADFDRLQEVLSPVPLLELQRGAFIQAARVAACCRRVGFQAGAVDCLIASACIEHGYPLLTADKHFLEIARCTDLIVLPPLGERTGA